MNILLKKYFYALNQLQKNILACYLNRDYFSRPSTYENKIHRARIELFTIMQKIRKQMTNPPLEKLEILYELILSLASLKLRIKDDATLEVCEGELTDITTNLSIVFKNNLAVKNIELLIASIDNFSELYYETLQIASTEPIIFLFFLQTLISLREQLEWFSIYLVDSTYAK